MISSRLAGFLKGKDLHYGWVIAATTFLTMLATAGAMGAAGVLIKPLEQEFGWQNSDISAAFALRLVLFGLMGPFAAAFMNHFGVRRVAAFALVTIAAGVAGSLLMTEVRQLVILWGVVVGLGAGWGWARHSPPSESRRRCESPERTVRKSQTCSLAVLSQVARLALHQQKTGSPMLPVIENSVFGPQAHDHDALVYHAWPRLSRTRFLAHCLRLAGLRRHPRFRLGRRFRQMPPRAGASLPPTTPRR